MKRSIMRATNTTPEIRTWHHRECWVCGTREASWAVFHEHAEFMKPFDHETSVYVAACDACLPAAQRQDPAAHNYVRSLIEIRAGSLRQAVHLITSPGITRCGADYPNMRSTEIRANVTCRLCS